MSPDPGTGGSDAQAGPDAVTRLLHARRLRVRREEAFHICPQLRVAFARVVQECGAFGGRQRECRVEQLVEPLEAGAVTGSGGVVICQCYSPALRIRPTSSAAVNSEATW